MTAENHATELAAEEWLVAHNVSGVLVAVTDTNGILRGKRISPSRFCKASEIGIPMSGEIFALDVAGEFIECEHPITPGLLPTSAGGFPDILAVPDLDTLRLLPWDRRTAIAMATCRANGVDLESDPRGILKRAVSQLETWGYEPQMAFEFEFYLLRETRDSPREKGYVGLQSVHPAGRTFSVSTQSAMDDVALRAIVDRLRSDFPIRTEHVESGPGQYEIVLEHGPALETADTAVLYRLAVCELARQEGMLATFMAKPDSSWLGNSCHIHISLLRDKREVFTMVGDDLSEPMRNFIAGTLDTLSECSAFQAPNVNSYKRFHADSWAGTTRTWGFDNRSVSVRVARTQSHECRVELRRPGSDVNPYLAAASALAAGAHGLATCPPLVPPTLGNATATPTPQTVLPQTLEDAAVALEGSRFARAAFGDEYINYYVAQMHHEVECARRAVTDWEVARYLCNL